MIDIQAMFPVMVAENLTTLKSFYTTVFGFNAVFFQPDFYLHLVHPSTGIQLGFLMPEHQSQPQFLHALMQSDGYVISLEVADAQKAYQAALELKLDMAMELKDETWGQRHFILNDPAGLKIDVVQHMEAPAH